MAISHMFERIHVSKKECIILLPGSPGRPTTPGFPGFPVIPGNPPFPDGPGNPEGPGIPGSPETPFNPGVPGLPWLPWRKNMNIKMKYNLRKIIDFTERFY